MSATNLTPHPLIRAPALESAQKAQGSRSASNPTGLITQTFPAPIPEHCEVARQILVQNYSPAVASGDSRTRIALKGVGKQPDASTCLIWVGGGPSMHAHTSHRATQQPSAAPEGAILRGVVCVGGSLDVLSWDAFVGAEGLSVPTVTTLQVPPFDVMCEDLAVFGLSAADSRAGVYQHLGAYMLD
eukprot:2828648-Amphidinium_carterae.2